MRNGDELVGKKLAGTGWHWLCRRGGSSFFLHPGASEADRDGTEQRCQDGNEGWPRKDGRRRDEGGVLTEQRHALLAGAACLVEVQENRLGVMRERKEHVPERKQGNSRTNRFDGDIVSCKEQRKVEIGAVNHQVDFVIQLNQGNLCRFGMRKCSLVPSKIKYGSIMPKKRGLTIRYANTSTIN